MLPGQIRVQYLAGKVEIIPTVNFILKMGPVVNRRAETRENLSEDIRWITKDAFEPPLPLSVGHGIFEL